MDANRRHLLCGIGGLAVGGAVAGLVAPALAAPQAGGGGARFAQAGGDSAGSRTS